MEVDYFWPDQSGFDSLKNSSFLNKLQGQDLEFLLYQYNNLVQEITTKELEYNDYIKNARKNFQDADINDIGIFYNLHHFDMEKESDEVQNLINAIRRHKSTSQVFLQASDKTPYLIIMYDNLNIIGTQIVRLISNNKKSFDNEAELALSGIYDVNGSIGYPKIINSGAINLSLYDEGIAHSQESELRMVYNLADLESRFKGAG
jgi:hypothetical protein